MQNNPILFIDTSEANRAVLALVSENTIKQSVFPVNNNLSEHLLGQILKLLGKTPDFTDLRGIVVVSGPGSYTGIRVGIATVNALSYACNLPIAGIIKEVVPVDLKLLLKFKLKNSFIKPFYSQPPHITTSKRKKNVKST